MQSVINSVSHSMRRLKFGALVDPVCHGWPHPTLQTEHGDPESTELTIRTPYQPILAAKRKLKVPTYQEI